MPSFDDWIKALDVHFMGIFGMLHNDFEDYDWYAEWEAQHMPKESFDEWRMLAGDQQ